MWALCAPRDYSWNLHSTRNPTGTLRGNWSYKGHVVSDCGAVQNSFDPAYKAPSLRAAAAATLKAGTDMDCGGAYKQLGAALKDGMIHVVSALF